MSFQLNKKEDMCMAFRILHDVLYKGKVAAFVLSQGGLGDLNLGAFG